MERKKGKRIVGTNEGNKKRSLYLMCGNEGLTGKKMDAEKKKKMEAVFRARDDGVEGATKR